MKALVMIRVSTEAQSTEAQHNEMEMFCRDEGYDELVFIEDKGASAIKLNDQYQMMIDQVKEEIEKDPGIRCFAVWELSRAFRNEMVYVQVKTFLLEHNVQFICKNPYLKLLNPDGSLNSGMEIAMSLLATLAKQEMDLKKERFHRAKSAMWKKGMFIGGTPKTGYRVDDMGYLVIDEEKAGMVRLIFRLYSTGRYSVRTLCDEVRERGYEVTHHTLTKMLSDRSYVDGPYPQMVSVELFESCERVRKENYISIPKGRKHCFGSGVFKCSVCGRNMIAEGDQYRCWHHNKFSAPPHCENSLTIRVENLDGLLWFVAGNEEVKYRLMLDRDRKKEYEENLSVLRDKRKNIEKKLESIEDKRSRIVELYVDGVITREEKEKKLSQTGEESKRYNDTILSYTEQEGVLLSLLEGKFDDVPDMDRLKAVYTGVIGESDIKFMDDIVKRQIVSVTSVASEFNGRKSAQLITVETRHSGVRKFYYVARKWHGHYFFTVKGERLSTVRKIIREPLGELDPKAFKKIAKE